MKKVKVKAKNMAADIHSGMGDLFLMQKYGLTAIQLEAVLKSLLQINLINDMQFYERTTFSDNQDN